MPQLDVMKSRSCRARKTSHFFGWSRSELDPGSTPRHPTEKSKLRPLDGRTHTSQCVATRSWLIIQITYHERILWKHSHCTQIIMTYSGTSLVVVMDSREVHGLAIWWRNNDRKCLERCVCIIFWEKNCLFRNIIYSELQKRKNYSIPKYYLFRIIEKLWVKKTTYVILPYINQLEISCLSYI
jgi:hypothetical protein